MYKPYTKNMYEYLDLLQQTLKFGNSKATLANNIDSPVLTF
jgi:hypothetical protein